MLSLILPTYKEAANLPELFAALKKVLTMSHEIIVVDDDSPDSTWKVAEELKVQYPTVRVLRRIGRRGLSSAVTEGFAMAKGEVLMVMDADLQHDPHLIIKLYDAIMNGADIAVASRYIEGGSVGDWVTGRRILSKTATWLASSLPPVHSSDPMSGFFALNRASYNRIAPKLRPTGFKILLEVLSCLPASTKLTEVPLHFAFRKHGESKLNIWVEVQFIGQLIRIVCKQLILALKKWQWWIFVATLLLALMLLAPRAWRLRLLYLDPSIRANVEETLRHTADSQGWLLSSMIVDDVNAKEVRILHREIERGTDTLECFHLFYHSDTVLPCAE